MYKTKICTKCNTAKSIFEFHKSKKTKDGNRAYCKVCRNEIYKTNRIEISVKNRIRRKQFPWLSTLQGIRQRCNNPNNQKYYCYGKRGIKCLITEDDLKKYGLGIVLGD